MNKKNKRISFEVTQEDHFQIKSFAAYKNMSIKGVFLTLLNKAINETKRNRR